MIDKNVIYQLQNYTCSKRWNHQSFKSWHLVVKSLIG